MTAELNLSKIDVLEKSKLNYSTLDKLLKNDSNVLSLEDLGVSSNYTNNNISYKVNINRDIARVPNHRDLLINTIAAKMGADVYSKDVLNNASRVSIDVDIDSKYRQEFVHALCNYSSRKAVKKALTKKNERTHYDFNLVSLGMLGFMSFAVVKSLAMAFSDKYYANTYSDLNPDVLYTGLVGFAAGIIVGIAYTLRETKNNIREGQTYESRIGAGRICSSMINSK